ncbi:MAG: hypothetical protein A2W37_13795 [Chloroflexi bacterium RBG_16_63_12]|nr:MAG: hypothetical protein A2W37_13795 [Chloroflexi bacterium RBG_16_63_12]
MFQSISRGFGFLGQAMDMARKDGDLIKPSLYGMVVGAIVSLVGAIPIIAVAVLSGGTDIGNFVLFVLGAILIFAQYAVAYIFSGMTAYLVYGFVAEGDGRMDKAWEVVQRDWLDILSLAAASTVVKLVENALRGRGNRRNLLGGMLAGLLERVWTTATYFILPIMVIEDLSLFPAVKRATEIVKKNLLLVAVTEIGVSGVVGLVGFILVVIAVGIGVGIFAAFSALGSTGAIIGAGAAVLVAGTLIALVSAFSSYVTTAYHTCMFLWARDAERAVEAGQSLQSVRVPAPVAAVLAG